MVSGNATVLAQIFNLITLVMLMTLFFYAMYAVLIKIPRQLKEQTELNQQLVRKVDQLVELMAQKNGTSSDK